MHTKTITLDIRTEDAEPILRQYAELAARYGALVDHMTKRTVGRPSSSLPLDECKAEWQEKFLRAKRIVESFGVDYEMTTAEETLTTYIPDKVLKSHLVKVAGVTFRHVDKSIPDPKNAMPQYRSGVHAEACKAAADRVVRRWRAALAEVREAA